MARNSASTPASGAEKTGIVVDTSSNGQGELSTDPLPSVKINNANLAEIKSSLDDAVKKVRCVPLMNNLRVNND